MKDSKVIICAGGEEILRKNKWESRSKINRHLVPIKQVPLIHYIQKQLLTVGFTNIYVACEPSNRERYILSNVNYICSPRRFGKFYENSCIYHYRRFLNKNGVTIILFGDTYYSDEIIDSLSKDNGQIFHVYGRHKSSNSVAKSNRDNEKFAYVINHIDSHKYVKICEQIMTNMEHIIEKYNINPTLFPQYVYYTFVGLKWTDDPIEDKHWVDWNDLTDDFDDANDLEVKCKLFPHIFT